MTPLLVNSVLTLTHPHGTTLTYLLHSIIFGLIQLRSSRQMVNALALPRHLLQHYIDYFTKPCREG